MLIVEVIVVLAVVFAVAAAAAGFGGSLTHFPPDRPGRGLPDDRPVRADDIDTVRFSLAFRGYRMSEVDDVLARLKREIAERDARIAELLGGTEGAESGNAESTDAATTEHVGSVAARAAAEADGDRGGVGG
ncbi:MAG: DivIVA domain-containing protein [Acidothermus sp.]|nr:DivIVA domain-containing protein [Acidothermus sp.]